MEAADAGIRKGISPATNSKKEGAERAPGSPQEALIPPGTGTGRPSG